MFILLMCELGQILILFSRRFPSGSVTIFLDLDMTCQAVFYSSIFNINFTFLAENSTFFTTHFSYEASSAVIITDLDPTCEVITDPDPDRSKLSDLIGSVICNTASKK